MKILLMGPQGCGKGTQGKKLSKHLGIPLIGVGNILRSLPEDHPSYKTIHDAIDHGNLAPQDMIADLLRERVQEPDCANGFIFDGWGRSMIDFEYFDPKFDKIVVLNLSRESSIKRITGRRMCSTDGKIYNINTLPKEELAKCKGELIQRVDDTEEAVNVRLNIYYTETVKTIEHFKKKGIVVEVDAEPMPDVIFENVLKALE